MISSLSQKSILILRSLLVPWKILLRFLSSRRQGLWMRTLMLNFFNFQKGNDSHCLNHYWLIKLSTSWFLIQIPQKVLQTIPQLHIYFWTKTKIVLPGKHLGTTVVSLAWLDFCKEQHILILRWKTINAKYLKMIYNFHMKDQSSVLAYIYWIIETREWYVDITFHDTYIDPLMLILQVDGKMLITTFPNQYYHAQVFYYVWWMPN